MTQQKTDPSIFNSPDPAPTNSPTAEPTSSELQYVGEGKKYKTDADLDKAYGNAETFIEQLKQDADEKRKTIEELSSELDKRKTAEEVAQALQQSKANTDSTKSSISAEDITRLVADTVPQVISAQQKEDSNIKNLKTVEAEMIKVLGTAEKANEVANAKAAENGLSIEDFMSLAQKSPEAALKIAGMSSNVAVAAPVASAQPNVNAQAIPDSNSSDESDWTYWQNLRREKPSVYHSPAMSMRRANLVGEGKLKPQQ